MEEAGILQEFTQYVANAGLTDFIIAECEQYHLLTNTFVQSFNFLPRNNPLEVQFNLYAEPHQIPLTEFCEIFLLPSDGGLVEPRAGWQFFPWVWVPAGTLPENNGYGRDLKRLCTHG